MRVRHYVSILARERMGAVAAGKSARRASRQGHQQQAREASGGQAGKAISSRLARRGLEQTHADGKGSSLAALPPCATAALSPPPCSGELANGEASKGCLWL